MGFTTKLEENNDLNLLATNSHFVLVEAKDCKITVNYGDLSQSLATLTTQKGCFWTIESMNLNLK